MIRNSQDRYSDPGYFVTKKNQYGENTLAVEGGNLHLIGQGYSDKGKRPFIDQFNIKTLKSQRLWQANNQG